MNSDIEVLTKKLYSTSSASSTCSDNSTTSFDSGLEKSSFEINEKNIKYFNKKIIIDENIRRKVSVESNTSIVDSIDLSSDDYDQQIDSDDLLSSKFNDINSSICKLKLSKNHHHDSDDSDDLNDDDDDLQEKGPVRSQMIHSRQQPYNNFYDNSYDVGQIDFDSTAKEIFSNSQYCYVINASLDKLTDFQQSQVNLEKNICLVNNSCQFDNKINEIKNNGEEKNEYTESLIDILNDLQPAQNETINNQNSSPSTSCTDNWPDSPASNYYIQQQQSNSQSCTSSRPHTPLSLINMDSPNTTINISNTSSPRQHKLNNYYGYYRIGAQSSSSSSNYSQCDTPSPKNYQNLIDNHNDEEKYDNYQKTWCKSCETTNNLNDKLKIININNNIYEKNQQCDINYLNDIKLQYNCKEDYNNNNLSTIDYYENNINSLKYDNTFNDLNNFITNQIDNNQLYNNVDLDTKIEDVLSTNYLNNNTINNQYNIINNNDILYNDNYHNLTTQTNISELKVEQQQKYYDETNKKLFNNFQIPKPVQQQQQQRKQYKFINNKRKKNLLKKFDPWKSLNMPKILSSKILKSKINDCDIFKAMKCLLQISNDKLLKTDQDGDTILMCLVGNPIELNKKKEYLIPLVERLSLINDGLTKVNKYGENALYLASMNCPKMYYVAGYLAGFMIDKGIDISLSTYTKGNNLIHELAKKGDAYKSVLSELLSLKTIQGKTVFDLSKCNLDGKTPLHIAVEAHDPLKNKINTISIVRLFIENGCDCKIKEYINGNTALHIAISSNCDPLLIQALLEKNGCDAVNIQNKNNNTPLHMIALLSDELSLNIQSNICNQLMKAGAQTNIKNNNEQLPLSIVTTKRKEFIEKIFYKSL